ncbi:MAG: hypothetical protein WD696_12440 [Bryobacteraceae bacterium]
MKQPDKSEMERDQPDRDLSKTTRPVPSQAEGDEETIDEDLRNKEGKP